MSRSSITPLPVAQLSVKINDSYKFKASDTKSDAKGKFLKSAYLKTKLKVGTKK